MLRVLNITYFLFRVELEIRLALVFLKLGAFYGGDRIEPEPVMKCSYAQAATDQVGKRKRPPVSCKLYDARSKKIKKISWKPEIVLNLCSVLAKSLKPPPFSYLLSDQEASSVTNTVIVHYAASSLCC